jgi:hypothetical protein
MKQQVQQHQAENDQGPGHVAHRQPVEQAVLETSLRAAMAAVVVGVQSHNANDTLRKKDPVPEERSSDICKRAIEDCHHIRADVQRAVLAILEK